MNFVILRLYSRAGCISMKYRDVLYNILVAFVYPLIQFEISGNVKIELLIHFNEKFFRY